MRRTLYNLSLITMLFCMILPVSGQKNLSLTGTLPFPGERTTDIWGYTDSSGNEYALVGREAGFSIIDISTDPANPDELFYIPHVNSGWRDIKTWDSYAYVTNEDSGGLLIVDMTYLPDSIRYHDWTGGIFGTAHNLFIDENGIGYILGFNGTGGALFVDLATDPYNPTFLGSYFTRYVHDAFVRNDTMWTAEINDGIFSVVNVSNKSNPVVMATQATPSNFAHNIWVSDDGNTVFTTDEVSGAFITSYDVSDLNNITELDRDQSSPGQNVIVHNTFVNGNFLVTSYYRDGVVITDATHPDNLIETGYYDTSPTLSGSGFNGCWGVYPYFPSGTIVASDMENGLFVLTPNYLQACYLVGNVTDSASGAQLQGALIEITSVGLAATTGLAGDYKTGTADAGTYDITFSKAGYKNKTINGVSLSNGTTTLQDAVLAAAVPFALTINIHVVNSLDPVPNAKALITNSQFTYDETANANGVIPIAQFYEGEYNIIIGKWGYKTIELSSQMIDAATNSITVELPIGYYDDYSLDFGWQSSGVTPFGGSWERDVPLGTSFNGSPVMNPDFDIADDIGAKCFVTGNDGDFDYVHGGSVFLHSPYFDLTGYAEPFLSFYSRLANYTFYGSAGDDTLIVTLNNGVDTLIIDHLIMDNFLFPQWKLNHYDLATLMTPTSAMQVSFEAKSPVFTYYELMEVGLDVFRVVDSAAITSLEPQVMAETVTFGVYPNPTKAYTQIEYYLPQAGNVEFKVHDLLGNLVDTYKSVHSSGGQQSYLYNSSELQSGVYLIQMNFGNHTQVKKLIITD